MKSKFFKCVAGVLAGAMLLQLAAKPVFTVAADKPDAIYQAGETATFTISVKDDGKAASGMEVMCAFRGEKNLPAPQKLTLDANGQAQVKGSLDHPGQLQIALYLPGDKINKTEIFGDAVRKYYGAMFSPEKIRPVTPVPADFNEFWDKEKIAMQKLPLNPVMKEIKAPAGFKLYSVCLDAPEGGKAYGYLSMPADAKPGTLPIYLRVHGAGIFRVLPLVKKDAVIFNLNPHELPCGKPQKFYDDARKKLEKLANGRYYMYLNETDHTKCYFLGMFRRNYRAMQFLTSRPEWNGRDFIVAGVSQGGAQTLACAGLEPRITEIYARVSALCDLGGFQAGRESGWPYRRPHTRRGDVNKLLAETAYVDVVNFARNIKNPKCVLTTGFADMICKSTSVYCAFNVIPAKDKKMITDPGAGHDFVWPDEAIAGKVQSYSGGKLTPYRL